MAFAIMPAFEAAVGPAAITAAGANLGYAAALETAGCVGAAFGMIFGGYAVTLHYALRGLLATTTPLPLRLSPLLDHAVDLALLRRVGGGYIFLHRTLLDHFAEPAR